jgi:hypothetical protein
MQFENSFTVPLPPKEAWAVLLDIERIAPCLPGAELTEVVDPTTFKGKVAVRLGPVALTFAGQVTLEDIDNDAYTARAKAQGSDTKGRGGANATVSFHLEPDGAGAKVVVSTDLVLSGSVAQYGRGVAMIKDLAGGLIDQFAASLETAGAASTGSGTQSAPPAAKPISGFTLLFKTLWRTIRRAFGAKDES